MGASALFAFDPLNEDCDLLRGDEGAAPVEALRMLSELLAISAVLARPVLDIKLDTGF